MDDILIFISIVIALIVGSKLLIFSIKEKIRANAWADAEIRVRQQADNFNLNINKDNNSADRINDIR